MTHRTTCSKLIMDGLIDGRVTSMRIVSAIAMQVGDPIRLTDGDRELDGKISAAKAVEAPPVVQTAMRFFSPRPSVFVSTPTTYEIEVEKAGYKVTA